MENYKEYLESKIAEAIELDMPITKDVYQDALDAYLSFQDADKLKGTRVVVIGEGPRINKAARFAEMYGSHGPGVHIMVGTKEMHDTMNEIFLNSMELSKNAPIQGYFADKLGEQIEVQRGITITQSMMEDRSIRLTAMPRMTEPLIPLDKYGKPLELPKSKFHR